MVKKYIGLEDMSNVNCSSVLNVIRNCRSVSRKQISDITGLSWGGMTKIVNKLLANGYIEEEKEESTPGVGRTPKMLSLVKNKNLVVGMDINREGFEAYVMNLGGDMRKAYMQKMTFSNKEELLDAIYKFTDVIVEDFKEQKILAIGIAMQGILDIENGISVEFPHCPDWKNVPLKAMLEERYGLRIYMEHDPNCILYSKMRDVESENILLLRLDRSVGMAASLSGEILRGNGVLEIAHCIVVPNGKICKCGKCGCLEAYVEPCLKNAEISANAEINGNVETNPKINVKALEELMEPLMGFVYNMTKIFHSDTILFTGKMAKYREQLVPLLQEEKKKYWDKEAIELEIMEEGALAVQGAALLAAQGAIEELQV